ncbi:MAG: hypothetical protein AABW67_00490 [Nanoarchaeota archaeon]
MKEENKEEAKLREGNISLVLNAYQDIFSDFDPRDYSEKSLSDDFLAECQRAARDKGTGFELRLLMPKHKRNIIEETKIKKRLKTHFQKHFKEIEKEINKIKREGLMWFFLGAIILVMEGFILQRTEFIFKFLIIIGQPASWFLFWEGLGKIFIESKKKKPDYEFYKKMSQADIYFLNY